jgi:hypothetical protein
MQGIFLRKYGVETKVDFVLFGTTGVDFKSDASHAAGDTTVMKDEGDEASTTNAFVDEGKGYSITLTATEMQAARVVVYVVDQGTKAWLDTAIVIETYGNASAMHAMDFDDAVRGGMTALPNAAADAAGGLPISDAGALDLDAKLANTNEVTAARMGALTDWINGGRLDLLLDQVISDLATATAYIDTEVAAVKAKTDNLPSDPADASVVAADIAGVPAAVIGATLSDLSDTDIDLGGTITVAKAIRAVFNRFYRKVIQTAAAQTVYNDSNAAIADMVTNKTETTTTRNST